MFQVVIAGANSTLSSVRFIANAIYEPDNIKQMDLDTINLFKLAKQNGFQTFYWSTQCNASLSSIGSTQYIDHVVAKEPTPIQIKF
jgi:glucan phosphoethanolaminetransferase (alkaline phosphatase superfamily)